MNSQKVLRKHVFIFSLVVFLMFTIFFLNDFSTWDHDIASGSGRSISIAEYVSQLRGLAKYTRDKKFGATSVLILTYMRSGSSLTGDIMQQASDSFYIYEPLWRFEHRGPRIDIITYVNGSRRLQPYDPEKEKNDVLFNWFTCDIGKIPTRAFTAGFMKFGKKSKNAQNCMFKYRSLPQTDALRLCGRELQKECLDSPIRIIKTIRMELESVSHLMDMLPNMKIVHLVRDPRATLFSQRKLGKCGVKYGGIEGCTESFCNRLENDVLEEERLLKLYPNRIKTVFYGDIARKPIATSQKMYDFVGTTFTSQARDYVFNITMAGNEDSCVICTTRSNSSEHIDSWKTGMNTEFINEVQTRCNYILKRYNFEILNTNS